MLIAHRPRTYPTDINIKVFRSRWSFFYAKYLNIKTCWWNLERWKALSKAALYRHMLKILNTMWMNLIKFKTPITSTCCSPELSGMLRNVFPVSRANTKQSCNLWTSLDDKWTSKQATDVCRMLAFSCPVHIYVFMSFSFHSYVRILGTEIFNCVT